MSTPVPLVSIIIPVFNRSDLTKQCLETLGKLEYKNTVEVIVVDNASTDDTQEVLGNFPPQDRSIPILRTYLLESNRNFSGACNFGADVAQGEYLCFLNNDTIPFNGFLEPLIQEADELLHKHDIPDCAVGSKLCFPNGTIQHAGVAFMRETRFPYHPYRGVSVDSPFVNHRRELQVVTGACLFTPAHTFRKLGQFSEAYRNGGEDITYCLKVREAGGKVIYRPDSALIHLESQSPGRLDWNDHNIETFWHDWPVHPLVDEDAFYFDDGLHRVGDRGTLGGTNLQPFKTAQEQHQWRNLAVYQKTYNYLFSATQGQGVSTVEQWPQDPAVLEWMGLHMMREGNSQEATKFLVHAARLRRVEQCKKADELRAQNSFLSPFLNKYFFPTGPASI